MPIEPIVSDSGSCTAALGDQEPGLDKVPFGDDPNHVLRNREESALTRRGATVVAASGKEAAIIKDLIKQAIPAGMNSIDTSKQVSGVPCRFVPLYMCITYMLAH